MMILFMARGPIEPDQDTILLRAAQLKSTRPYARAGRFAGSVKRDSRGDTIEMRDPSRSFRSQTKSADDRTCYLLCRRPLRPLGARRRASPGADRRTHRARLLRDHAGARGCDGTRVPRSVGNARARERGQKWPPIFGQCCKVGSALIRNPYERWLKEET